MTRKDTDYNNNNNDNSNNYNKFERKISRLFDDFLNDVGFTRTHGSKFRGEDGGKHNNWSPAIDIKEVDREYLVIADVPGVRKEDIDIELHDSVLILSGYLNQDIFSTPQAQEINIGKDNRQQPQQYPQPQQYQQQPPPPQAYQQSTEPPRQQQQPLQQPQPYQQTTQQQPTEAQQYQQAVDQKYNLSNEPQQQSNNPQYQQQSNDPNYQRQSNDPNYNQQSNNPQYQQQSNDPNYQRQSNDPNYHQQSNNPQYQQQSNNPQYQQQSNDPNYQQQSNDPNYQQQTNEFQHIKNRRHRDSRGERFHIQERPYGNFSRSIQLPSNIKSDDEFHASLENGVLKIRVPKNNDKPRRKITIK